MILSRLLRWDAAGIHICNPTAYFVNKIWVSNTLCAFIRNIWNDCQLKCAAVPWGRKQNITSTLFSIWSASINNSKSSQKTWTSFVCRKLQARTNFWVMMRRERRVHARSAICYQPFEISFLENKTKTKSWCCLCDLNVFKLSCPSRLCGLWLRDGVPAFTVRSLCFSCIWPHLVKSPWAWW